MTTFDDKEKAAENKYAHDREIDFKVLARAHKLLGLWVAGKMRLAGAQAEEYAKSLVMADLAKANQQHLFHKIKTDLLAHDVHITDHDLRMEMHQLEQKAREQVAG